jgi:hypothetical protein
MPQALTFVLQAAKLSHLSNAHIHIEDNSPEPLFENLPQK